MIIRTLVKKSAYYDSVTLMAASGSMRNQPGVVNASIMMGTAHNRALMQNAGLIAPDAPEFTPNDAVIGILCETEDAAGHALRALEEYFAARNATQSGENTPRVRSLSAAFKANPKLNFEIISVPGRYARVEAEKALDHGLHVLLFSDNVSLADEIALKEKAVQKGLLMMGPDCGTAIINGTALGFANVVKRGQIGLVAAAGTGLQEVCVLIDRLGGGVSQALGAGGRDLKEAVGGRMMLMELDALKHDADTSVIVVISKPPHPTVLKKLAAAIRTIGKPVIACLLGGAPELLVDSGAVFAKDLEEAARLAVSLSGCPAAQAVQSPSLIELAEAETAAMSGGQTYLRGLYSGGTLCYESLLALHQAGIGVRSNIALSKDDLLPDPEQSADHTLLDMGDDYFTNGIPHPMIDPRLRVERILREAEDGTMAVLLLDCVCGYGSHENPAAAIASAIRSAKETARQNGGYLSVIASVCATEADPQKRSAQERALREAGVVVMPCNAQAAALAAEIVMKRIRRA